jgi:glutaredoxin 3
MKPVKVYTTSWCPYCVQAKRLLTERKIPFEEIDCENDDALRAWLVKTTGQRTVPQIFIGDEPVGGYSDISALDKKGLLVEKVTGRI